MVSKHSGKDLMKPLLIFALMLSFSALVMARIPNKHIVVQPSIRNELNLVLKSTSDLHRACIEKDENTIENATEKVIQSLDRAAKNSSLIPVESTHLVKMLSAAKEKLEISQNFSGQRRKQNLQEAFKDLVQIAQVFKLEPYHIFFCNKDNSLWLQKSAKPVNPIHPDRFGKCGRLVQ